MESYQALNRELWITFPWWAWLIAMAAVLYVRGAAVKMADRHFADVSNLTEEVTELSNRLDLAAAHLAGEECPECYKQTVVQGCSGKCCILCDWVEEE